MSVVSTGAGLACSASTAAPTSFFAGAGGATTADGAAGGGSGGAPTSSAGGAPELVNAPPGSYLTELTTEGYGPCIGHRLAALLDGLRATTPELADVKALYAPATPAGDGSFIYPYLRADGGFDVVFKRGAGDCPAGCTQNDYDYFATDGACALARVGHYHAAWGASSCLTVEGTPMWSHPPPPDPLTVCGQDNAAQDLRGTYRFRATGQRQECIAAGEPMTPYGLDLILTAVVAQDGQNLKKGTVTFSGTGHPMIDGVPLPASFQRRRFDAALQWSNLPSACPREHSVTGRFDFEYYQPGGLEVVELGSDACTSCKGTMNMTLTGAP